MTSQNPTLPRPEHDAWLKRYYLIRALFSIVWVALTLSVHSRGLSAVLLVIYPAWDALANYIDASRSGGARRNVTQTLNVAISGLTTVAVIVALQASLNLVMGVFGVWAILSGLLQLGTAVRRWKAHGAQWSMVLSGAQSALAGALFIVQSASPTPPSVANIAGYAGVGALYFLISTLWLSVTEARRKRASASS